MSQSSHSVGNVSAPAFRAAMNDSLQALASLNSGSSEPSTTYANMLWYDTANNILKMRSEADDAWINVAYVDQSANAWRVLDDTQVVNTSGTQTGLIGDQTTATWEAGTGTTESLVSPAKVKAAIEALVPPPVEQDFVFLARAVLSNNATADFTAFDGTNYDSYMFVISNARPSVSTGSFNLQMSSNGGSTYDAASNSYYYAWSSMTSGGTAFTGGGQSGTIALATTIVVGTGYSGIVKVHAPHTSTEKTKITYESAYQAGTNAVTTVNGGGVRNADVAVNGIRFFFNAANLTSGTITMYGMRNA